MYQFPASFGCSPRFLYVSPWLAQSLISLRSLFKAQIGLSVFQSERGQTSRQKQEFRPENSWNRKKPKLIWQSSALGLTPRGANRHQGSAHVHRKVLKRPWKNVTGHFCIEVSVKPWTWFSPALFPDENSWKRNAFRLQTQSLHQSRWVSFSCCPVQTVTVVPLNGHHPL